MPSLVFSGTQGETESVTETGTISTPDSRVLAMCEWGPPDGAPVFFLHGAPGCRLLRHVGGMYDRAEARVVTYDRPGYGRSTRLPGRQVSHCAADVAAIADHLTLDSFAVCGASGGGPHALAVAALLGSRVSRCATIVSLGPYTAPDLDFHGGWSPEEAHKWRLTEQGGDVLADVLRTETAELLEAFPLDGSTDAEYQMLAEAVAESAVQGIEGWLDDELSFVRPWGFDVTDIAVPTQIMVARDDEMIPATHGRWLADHISARRTCNRPGHPPRLRPLRRGGTTHCVASPRLIARPTGRTREQECEACHRSRPDSGTASEADARRRGQIGAQTNLTVVGVVVSVVMPRPGGGRWWGRLAAVRLLLPGGRTRIRR
jgi:pimeloyl-ACP methyl ester carboxylesterase